MAISEKKERDLLREKMFNEIITILVDSGSELIDDVMPTKSNKFCFPCVGDNGTELFCEITVSIPTGSKDEPYNGYELAQDYIFKCEEDERKRQEREKKKEEKKKKDEEKRKKIE